MTAIFVQAIIKAIGTEEVAKCCRQHLIDALLDLDGQSDLSRLASFKVTTDESSDGHDGYVESRLGQMWLIGIPGITGDMEVEGFALMVHEPDTQSWSFVSNGYVYLPGGLRTDDLRDSISDQMEVIDLLRQHIL